jgi:hypothetical protein
LCFSLLIKWVYDNRVDDDQDSIDLNISVATSTRSPSGKIVKGYNEAKNRKKPGAVTVDAQADHLAYFEWKYDWILKTRPDLMMGYEMPWPPPPPSHPLYGQVMSPKREGNHKHYPWSSMLTGNMMSDHYRTITLANQGCPPNIHKYKDKKCLDIGDQVAIVQAEKAAAIYFGLFDFQETILAKNIVIDYADLMHEKRDKISEESKGRGEKEEEEMKKREGYEQAHHLDQLNHHRYEMRPTTATPTPTSRKRRLFVANRHKTPQKKLPSDSQTKGNLENDGNEKKKCGQGTARNINNNRKSRNGRNSRNRVNNHRGSTMGIKSQDNCEENSSTLKDGKGKEDDDDDVSCQFQILKPTVPESVLNFRLRQGGISLAPYDFPMFLVDGPNSFRKTYLPCPKSILNSTLIDCLTDPSDIHDVTMKTLDIESARNLTVHCLY